MVGTISIKHVYEIAKIKMKDMDITEKEMCKVIAGTARSLGIKIVR